MEYINEFVKYKEAKGEKAIYRVNDTRGYTYYSDDYVKWLEQQLRLFAVVGRSEQLVAFLKWVGDGYDFENNAEKIVKEYIDEGN
jgi:hypothetical protein